MMHLRHLLLLAAALTVTVPAIAQSVPQPDTGETDGQPVPGTLAAASAGLVPRAAADDARGGVVNEAEIVVTSARWKELLAQPLPVTLFSAEDRNLVSAATTAELVNLTPGFTFTQTFGLNVRGVGRQTNQNLLGQENAILQYVDGFLNLVPSNIAESTLFGGNVQFSRGPQGTRYGRNALAGAVNLISRAPTKEFRGEVDASYGRANSYSVGANIAGPITDNFGIRLGAQHYDAPTTRTNIGTARGAGYAVRNNYFEFQMEWSPGPFHIRTRTTTFIYDNQPDYNSPSLYNTTAVFGGLDPNPQYHYVVPSPTTPYTVNIDDKGFDRLRDNLQQIVNADLDLGGASLVYVGGFQKYRAIGQADLDLTSRASYVAAPADPFAPGAVVPTRYTSNYDNRDSFWSQELRLESKKQGPFKWIVGAYHFNQDYDETYYEAIPGSPLLATPTIGAAGGTTAPNPNLATYQQRNIFHVESTAGFGNLTWTFAPTLELDAGLRYTFDEKNAQTNFRYVFSYPPFFAGDVTPAAHSATPFARDEGLSGHAVLTWRPKDGIETYASYARGYQSSAFTLGQGLPPNNIAAPEHLDVYEIGGKYDFTSTIHLDGSIFYQNLFNLQVPISSRALNAAGLPLGPVFQQFVNAHLARIYGVEAEASWQPVPGANLTVNYTYLHPTFQSFCPGLNPATCGAVDITEPAAGQTPQNLAGNEVPRAPRNKISAFGYYTVGIGSYGSIIPGASVSWQDSFYTSPFQKDRFRVAARTVTNFTLTYRTAKSNFDLVASVNNAFRAIYADDVTVTNQGGTAVVVTPIRGVTSDRYYSLTGRFRF